MKRLLLLLALLFPGLALAQTGIVYHDIAVYNSGSYTRVIPGALITVCTGTVAQLPCDTGHGGPYPLTSIFNDAVMASPAPNPFIADANGNFFFYMPAGYYIINISAPSGSLSTVPPYAYPIIASAGSIVLVNSTLGFSNPLNIDGTKSKSYSITLTGNVTSSVVTGTPLNGNLMKLHICQGAGGPWIFAFPVNFLNTTAIQNTGCTDETYSFDGTNWSQLTQPSGGGGGGGSCSSVGATGTIQAAGTAGACQSTNLIETANGLQVNEDTQSKGPNPSGVDIRAYGAVSVAFNAAPFVPGITATINSTSTSAALSSPSTFVNAMGVDIIGAGATNALSTPSAPTVTCVLAAAPTGTGYVVPCAAGGSETTCYTNRARDKGQGVTAASAETCVTGQTRGVQTVTISNCIRTANTLVTCTIASPHTLATGAWIQIKGTTNDPEYAGYFLVASSADNMHFTYQWNRDSRAGASTIAATGGTVTYWQGNHIVFNGGTAPPAGVWQYAVNRGATDAETLADVSTLVNPGLSGDASYMTWEDWGTTYTTVPKLPVFWPTSTSSPATNDTLVTTIVSGAGTTTLVLANAASNSVTNATILSDATPNILAAFAAAQSGKTMVYIPAIPGIIGTNSILDTTSFSGTAVSVAGQLWFGDTLVTRGVWHGDLTIGLLSTSQFGIQGLIPVNIAAKPGISITTGNFYGLYFQPQGSNANSFYINQGSIPTATFDTCGFPRSSDNADFATVPFYGFTQTGAGSAGVKFKDSFFSGVAQGITPLFISKNFGEITLDGMSGSGRGFFIGVCPNCTGTNVEFTQKFETQTLSMPFFTTRGAVTLKLDTIIEDTGSQPIVANLGGQLFINGYLVSEPSGGIPQYTGTGIQSITGANVPDNQQGVNINYSGQQAGVVYDGVYNTTQAIQLQNTHFALGPNYSLFTNAGSYAAPTCSVVTAGPPFSMSAFGSNTYTFAYVPIYPNGGLGIPSGLVSCTMNGSTQQATITIPSAIPAATGYQLLFGTSGGLGNFVTTPFTTLSILVPSCASGCAGQSSPSYPGGGPAGIQNDKVWSDTYNLFLYADVAEIAAPANPATGFERWYANNTTHLFTCLTSSGGSCGGGGGGVSSFSSSNLTPLFTTSVANPTTIPSLSFALSTAGPDLVFANCTGSTAAPTYCGLVGAMIPPINLAAGGNGGVTGLLPNASLANSSVNYNGQAVALGASGNVNSGATAHGVALNEGNGSPISGVVLAAHQTIIGKASLDPIAATINDCNGGSNALTYVQSSDTFGCNNISAPGGIMTTLGDMIFENATPAPARLPGPTGPNGVPQTLTDTPAAGAATAEVWALAGVPVNNNSETTCASYTLNVLDRATNIRCSGGSTATVTVPVHTTAGFASNYPVDFTNQNSGTLTLTVTSPDTIDGGSAGGSQTVFSNWDARMRQDSSGNWYTDRVPTFAAFGSTCGDATHALSWSTSTGFGCQSISGSGVTIQTNGTNNTLQTTLNFVNPSSFNGLTFTFSNPTAGNETFALGGTLNNAGLTNASTTVNGVTCTLGSTCAPLPNATGNSDVTGQSTSQSAVTLATSPTAGHYLITYYADMSAACSTGANAVNFTFNWTDASNARTLTTGNLSLSTAQTTSSYLAGSLPIWVASGNITYTSTVVGSCATGTSSYDIHAKLERLQ